MWNDTTFRNEGVVEATTNGATSYITAENNNTAAFIDAGTGAGRGTGTTCPIYIASNFCQKKQEFH